MSKNNENKRICAKCGEPRTSPTPEELRAWVDSHPGVIPPELPEEWTVHPQSPTKLKEHTKAVLEENEEALRSLPIEPHYNLGEYKRLTPEAEADMRKFWKGDGWKPTSGQDEGEKS